MDTHGEPHVRRTALSELATGFRQSTVILTANQLGVFHCLSDQGKDLKTLAKEMDLSERGLGTLMNALVALDLIEIKNDKYFLYGEAAEFLRDGSRDYLGDIFRHNFHLLKNWIQLDEAVKIGKTPLVEPAKKTRTDDELKAFILGMENISRSVSIKVAHGLDMTGVKRILDLGSGPGTYLYAMLHRCPEAKGVLLDLPRVIAIAREQLEKSGLKDRVTLLEGNMHEADFQGTYDLIFLGNIIHSWGEAKNRQLFKKCAEALNPGGRLVVKDFFLDDSRTKPLHGALFALNMLVGTEEGRAYSWREGKKWMTESGLNVVQSYRVANYSGVLIGKK